MTDAGKGLGLNVVLIIADTVRWDFLGFNGGHARTPALDALAADATVFKRHYAASFPTVPARYDIHTGKPAYADVGWGPLPPGEVTVAMRMDALGHATVGVVDTPFYLVNGHNYDRGFRYFYDTRRQPLGWPPVPQRGLAKARQDYPVGDVHTRQLVPRPRIGEADHAAPATLATAETCLEYLYEAPFFLLVDTWDPHEPWNPPRYYSERYLPGHDRAAPEPPYGFWQDHGLTKEDIDLARGHYAAELEMVDRWIGRLLDKLERTGVRDRTAVVFTSDHGYYFGEHGIYGKMVREDPGEIVWRRSPLYEEVAKVPLLVSVPGQRPGVVDAITSALDIAPTLIELAGGDPGNGGPGQSLVPAVRGDSFRGHDSVVTALPLANLGDEQAVVDDFTRTIGEWQPITLTTEEWSLLYATPDERIELYQLTEDPSQADDVSGQYPSVVERLVRDLVESHLQPSGAPEGLLSPRRPR